MKGDTIREANSDEVAELRKDNEQLKDLLSELSLKNRGLHLFVFPKYIWANVSILEIFCLFNG